jgi:hypothetical protein
VCWSLGFGSLRKRPDYFRSISASSPKTTGRAALSSSRSISNSPRVRVSGDPELTDPLDSVEVREAKDVEKLRTSGRREGHEAGSEPGLYLLEGHGGTLVRIRYRRDIDKARGPQSLPPTGLSLATRCEGVPRTCMYPLTVPRTRLSRHTAISGRRVD